MLQEIRGVRKEGEGYANMHAYSKVNKNIKITNKSLALICHELFEKWSS